MEIFIRIEINCHKVDINSRFTHTTAIFMKIEILGPPFDNIEISFVIFHCTSS